MATRRVSWSRVVRDADGVALERYILNAIRYTVQRRTRAGNSGSPTAWSNLGSNLNVLTYDDTGELTGNVQVQYRVRVDEGAQHNPSTWKESTWILPPTLTYSNNSPDVGDVVTATLSNVDSITKYEWEVQTVGSGTWSKVASSDSTRFTIPSNASTGDKYRLRWYVSNVIQTPLGHVTVRVVATAFRISVALDSTVSGSVSVGIRRPSSNPSVPVRIRYSKNASFAAPLFFAPAAPGTTANNITISGLETGTYYFQGFFVINGNLTSSNIVSIEITVVALKPTVTLSLAKNVRQFVVATITGGNTATNYTLQRAANSNFANILETRSGTISSSPVQELFTQLPAGTHYFRAQTRNASRISDFATASITTTGAPPPPPPPKNPPHKPSITAVIGSVATSVDVSVTDASTGGTPTSYTIQRDTNVNFSNPISETNSRGSHTFTNLTAGNHYFRARASNTDGDSPWSDTATVRVRGTTPPPPPNPPGVPSIRVVKVGRNGATVTVTQGTGTTPTSYTIRRVMGSTTQTVNVSTSDPSHTFNNLAVGTHTFSARATNSAGNSAYSSTSSITVAAPPPGLSANFSRFRYTARPRAGLREIDLDWIVRATGGTPPYTYNGGSSNRGTVKITRNSCDKRTRQQISVEVKDSSTPKKSVTVRRTATVNWSNILSGSNPASVNFNPAAGVRTVNIPYTFVAPTGGCGQVEADGPLSGTHTVTRSGNTVRQNYSISRVFTDAAGNKLTLTKSGTIVWRNAPTIVYNIDHTVRGNTACAKNASIIWWVREVSGEDENSPRGTTTVVRPPNSNTASVVISTTVNSQQVTKTVTVNWAAPPFLLPSLTTTFRESIPLNESLTVRILLGSGGCPPLTVPTFTIPASPQRGVNTFTPRLTVTDSVGQSISQRVTIIVTYGGPR